MKRTICGAVLILTMAIASDATALAYSVTNSIAFSGGVNVSGTINRVTTHFIPAVQPSMATAGTVTSPGVQDFVWFSITLDAGSSSIDRVDMTVLPSDILDAEQYPQGTPLDVLFAAKNPSGSGGWTRTNDLRLMKPSL